MKKLYPVTTNQLIKGNTYHVQDNITSEAFIFVQLDEEDDPKFSKKEGEDSEYMADIDGLYPFIREEVFYSTI